MLDRERIAWLIGGILVARVACGAIVVLPVASLSASACDRNADAAPPSRNPAHTPRPTRWARRRRTSRPSPLRRRGARREFRGRDEPSPTGCSVHDQRFGQRPAAVRDRHDRRELAACGACSARRTSIGSPRRSAPCAPRDADDRAASTSATPATTTAKHPFRVIYRGARARCVRASRHHPRRATAIRVRGRSARRRGDVRRAKRRHRAHHEAPAGGRRRTVCVRRSCSRSPRVRGARRVSRRAALVDSLPIVPGSAPLRLITDAALSPDAKHLAVRTYAQLFVFATIRRAVASITASRRACATSFRSASRRARA